MSDLSWGTEVNSKTYAEARELLDLCERKLLEAVKEDKLSTQVMVVNLQRSVKTWLWYADANCMDLFCKKLEELSLTTTRTPSGEKQNHSAIYYDYYEY